MWDEREGNDYTVTDDQLNESDTEHLTRHNEQFSDLLCSYVNNYKESCKSKLKDRKWLFWVSVALMCIITIVTVITIIWSLMIIKDNRGNTMDVLPQVVGSVVSLISAILVIPKIIAGYLYNMDEEKYLADIIGKIQDYDSSRKLGSDPVKELQTNCKQDVNNILCSAHLTYTICCAIIHILEYLTYNTDCLRCG